MARIKIAHIITGLKRGGAETVLLRLVTHLTDFEHQVMSLRTGGDLEPDFARIGVPVLPFRLRHLRRFNPDIVQTWMYHGDLVGGLAARALGYKNVIWNIRNSTLDPKQTKWTTLAAVKLCARLSAYIPRTIVTCSHHAQQVHEALGYASNKSPNKFQVIPNGIDCQVFRPHAPWRHKVRAHLNLPVDTTLIGMVARFDPQKDFPTFIQAAQKICEHKNRVHFVLIGPNNQDIPQTNLPITILGTRQDIPEILNALDLFVLSSAYGEAFPNAIAEAMACDIPCVATNVGDTAAIIGDIGMIVPPRDPTALALACLQVLEAAPSGMRQRIIDLFDLNRMVEQYRQLYLTHYNKI